MKDASTSIVNFIANLTPLYKNDQMNGTPCARSLRDGTLLIPVICDADNPDPWVTVWWQGHSTNSTDVLATQMASIALLDYVALHSLGTRATAQKDRLNHLSQHFTVKTGHYLFLPNSQEDVQISEKIIDIVRRYEPNLVIEVLKKGFGL